MQVCYFSHLNVNELQQLGCTTAYDRFIICTAALKATKYRKKLFSWWISLSAVLLLVLHNTSLNSTYYKIYGIL